MNNEILDEAEKYTGPRICPECGYQFPFGIFARWFIMSYGLSKWSCRGCGELLKYDSIKIQMLWLVVMLVAGVLIGVLIPYFDLILLIIIFLIPSLVFILMTLFYVKFEKYK